MKGKRFAVYKEPGFLWFRIYGYGLIFKDTHKHSMLFSERNKIRKHLRFGKWLIKWLSPAWVLYEAKPNKNY